MPASDGEYNSDRRPYGGNDAGTPRPMPGARRLHLHVPAGARLRVTLSWLSTGDSAKQGDFDEYALLSSNGAAGSELFLLDGSGGEVQPQARLSIRNRIQQVLPARRPSINLKEIRAERAAWILFLLALLVFAASRLIRIEDYPISFLTDEANQANLAEDLLRDGLRDYEGTLLPTYFKNVYEYNLSLSVYLQLLPVRLFGKSVAVTRTASALVTIIGAAAVGLSLDLLTGRRRGWLGVLLFGLPPAWFLHSRTAFETSLMVSFYACFLYSYLLYRLRSPRYLSMSILFAALTFYSYAPGQAVIAISTLVLLAVDWRYHRDHYKTLLINLPLLALAVLPYMRFQWQHPGEHTQALRLLGSYWLQDLSLTAKIRITLENYLGGLDPAYWLTPNLSDLARHQMDAFGSYFLPMFPLLLIGLVLALQRWRDPAERTVLVSLFIVPCAGIPAGVGITRLLALIVPAVLLSGLGLSWLIDRANIPQAGRPVITAALFTLLAGLQAGILADALERGPLYSQDYGMNGMQYGAVQVFGRIEQMLEANPDLHISVSPTWANGVDVLRRFFLPDDAPVEIANTAGYLENLIDLDPARIFVLTTPEVEELKASSKIGSITILDRLLYPNGFPGLTFLSMRYSADAPEIFAAEVAERQRPKTAALVIDGIETQVEFPFLDLGSVDLMFDHDPFTLARVYEANPARIVLRFSRPRDIQGLRLTTGSMDFGLSVALLDASSTELSSFSQTYRDLPDDPTVEWDAPGRISGVSSIVIEIFSLTPGDPFKIHIREIEPF